MNMATRLSDEQRIQIDHEYPLVIGEVRTLLQDLLDLEPSFKKPEAAKFWKYGVLRRLNRMGTCLERFHDGFKSELNKTPPSEELRFEQTLLLNMCIMDFAGGLDNLARAILLEKGVVLPTHHIALHRKESMKHLPAELLVAKQKYQDWLNHLQSFRDPLAHRISPYVLPYLQFTNGNRSFDTYYTADFDDSALVLLHPKILCDVRTFNELIKAGIAGLKSYWS